MELVDCSQSLRSAQKTLFTFVEEFGGRIEIAPWKKNRFKVIRNDKVVHYIHFHGDGARKRPKNSVLLLAQWHDDVDGEGVFKGKNAPRGQPSAELTVMPDDPTHVEQGKEFIRRAFAVNRR